MRFQFTVAVVIAAATNRCPAQDVPAASREAAPADAARVERIFAPWNRTDSPGCAVGVIRDGVLVYGRGFGMANLEHGIPIDTRTVFDLGSTSKQFTAACIMMLVLDGKIGLDDDVRKWIPELPTYASAITVRHLVHHTSGIRDYLELLMLRGARTEDWTTPADALSLIARQKATNFAPGARFLYSNSGYFLLSQIVERVSGKTLARFADERLFAPLAMRETHVHDDHGRIVKRRATGYTRRPGGEFAIDMSDFEQTGDGAVMSTVEDLVLWERNFDSRQVGGAALADLMHARGALADGTSLDYAAGLMIGAYRGLRTVRHGGAWAGYRAELLRFPDERLAVVCLCNLAIMNPSRLAERVAEVWLGDRMTGDERPSSRPDSRPAAQASASRRAALPDVLHPFCGSFRSDELDVVWEIVEGASGISARSRPGPPLSLRAAGGDRFVGGGVTLEFLRDESGAVVAFHIELNRAAGIRFDRVAVTRR